MSITVRAREVIKKLRNDNNLSLNDVAHGIGYETAKGYYDLESGKTDIKLEHIERLSKFYKVPVEFFLSQNSTNVVHVQINSDNQPELPKTG